MLVATSNEGGGDLGLAPSLESSVTPTARLSVGLDIIPEKSNLASASENESDKAGAGWKRADVGDPLCLGGDEGPPPYGGWGS